MSSLKRVTASGTVTNTGNANTTFKVNLWTQKFDDLEDYVGPIVRTAAPGFALAPGAISNLITIVRDELVQPGWRLTAHVSVDITAPVEILAVASSPVSEYTEPVEPVYGGTWSGSAPGIALPFAFNVGVEQGVAEGGLNPWIPVGIIGALTGVCLWVGRK